MSEQAKPAGMGRKTARRIEFTIIGLCFAAMVMIFQPFSKLAFSIGCVLVVIGGLAFNLVPLCRPDRQLKSLVRAGVVVLIVFVVVTLLAIGSAELYGVYLRYSR